MTIDTLPLWISIPVAILLVISGLLAFTGSLGLLRLPDVFSRIHAPTLGNTLGIFSVLVASILTTSMLEKTTVFHYLIISILLFITSPVTAMLLMRAAIRRKTRTDSQRHSRLLEPNRPKDTEPPRPE